MTNKILNFHLYQPKKKETYYGTEETEDWLNNKFGWKEEQSLINKKKKNLNMKDMMIHQEKK